MTGRVLMAAALCFAATKLKSPVTICTTRWGISRRRQTSSASSSSDSSSASDVVGSTNFTISTLSN